MRALLFLRLLAESAMFAFQALLLNRLRTTLSILGIVLGIFCIILTLSITNSLERNIRDSVNSLGTDVIYVQKWPWGGGGGEYQWWKYMNRPLPKINELYDLQKTMAGNQITDGVAYLKAVGGKTIKYVDNNISDVAAYAVTYEYDRVANFEIEKGRYFSEFEHKSGRPCIILGYQVYEGLFGSADPIGKEVVFMGRKLEVIGVIKRQGESLLQTGLDYKVLVPATWLQRVSTLGNIRGEEMIMVKASQNATLEELESELKGKMRSIRKLKPNEDDNFALNRVTMISAALDSLFWAVNIGGMVIGLFSVLVGGFGIANIMFVSVNERTGQIGIQKSLGARNSFILVQFLTEAIVLCLLGGILGIGLVYVMVKVGSLLTDFNLFLSFNNFLLGTGISVGVGVISGFIPAYRASRLDPVEAIRTKI